MKTVTSISGGQTSAYLAVNYPTDYNVFSLVRIEDDRCKFPDAKLRQEVEDRIQKPFIATAEDDTIIHTILDLEQMLGRKIDWVSGDTFEQVIEKHGQYLPNKIARYCTTDLKTEPIAKWLYDNKLNPAIMSFGYRANEKSRAKNMLSHLNENGFIEVKIKVGKHKNGNNKWKTIEYQKPVFPLIENNIYRDNIVEFWKLNNRVNKNQVRFAPLNNCVGCWWRTPLLLKKMSIEHPNKLNWFAEREEKGKGTFQTGVTYRQIIAYKQQTELSFDDFSSCDSGYCGV